MPHGRDPHRPARNIDYRRWRQLARWRRIVKGVMLGISKGGCADPEISGMAETLQPPRCDDDATLLALGAELRAAALLAQDRLETMPDHSTIAAEAAAIEQILQPGEAIAGRMLRLRPVTPEGIEAQRRAGLWQRGEYIGTCLPALRP